MKKYIGLIILLSCFSSWLVAGESYCFRVYLKDKGDAGCTVEQPETFLSQESIQRRKKTGTPVSASDLPIAPAYLDTLASTGAKPVVQSKWFSTVVVASSDSTVADKLKELVIVDSVKWVWKGTDVVTAESEEQEERYFPADTPLKAQYGYAEEQIKMLNGIELHEAGFRGEGMRIAVIDAGFQNVDRISVFDSLQLIGTHNVIYPERSVYEADDHGTKVLSCLAADMPGIMVGTAPKASYLLIKSEDSDSEYPIEEDYWAAAVEYADSVGVDVITSSLGYFAFDADELSYDQDALDGKTALISRVAHEAAEKGILMFCSAGNEGSGQWGKITFPSDASDVLTVGAVTEDKKKSVFSSVGFTADYRVKPDVVALGSGSCVIDPRGNVRYASGTSFATPILAGLGVCLWQALPRLSNKEIIALLQQVSSQAKRPDAELGYGIPNVYKAYKKGLEYAGNKR
ncbi:MAG: S8 family serine peptidase [Parabacteroides sp.]|nr:S8 family serine peptidase [Parabacteroides sp.]